MPPLAFVILMLGAICFLLAAIGVNSGRFNLIALGLLLWLLVTMFGK